MYYAVTVLYCTIIKYLLSCNAGAIIFQPKRHSFCNLLKIEIDVNWWGGGGELMLIGGRLIFHATFHIIEPFFRTISKFLAHNIRRPDNRNIVCMFTTKHCHFHSLPFCFSFHLHRFMFHLFFYSL